MRWVIKLALFAFLFFAAERFCRKQTDGFSLHHIQSDLPFEEEEELSAEEKTRLAALLSQRFHYFAKGAQCYVFLSEDGSTILKFFKHHHLRLPFLLSRIPLPTPLSRLRAEKSAKKAGELQADFASYEIAQKQLKEETGLLFMHLHRSRSFKQLVTIVDKLHIAHQINLGEVEFLIQKKAELVYPVLSKLVSSGDLDGAKRRLDSLIHLLTAQRQKGVGDLDPNFSKNFGFIGEEAIQIDIGRFTHADDGGKLVQRAEDFRYWLERLHPELATYFSHRLCEL
jgi:hypothetical protein